MGCASSPFTTTRRVPQLPACPDALITVDTNLRYRQNLAGRKIAIVVLHSSSNRLDHLRQHFPPVF
jgi:hypothetical protein